MLLKATVLKERECAILLPFFFSAGCRSDGWSLSSHLSLWWKHCTENAASIRDKDVRCLMLWSTTSGMNGLQAYFSTLWRCYSIAFWFGLHLMRRLQSFFYVCPFLCNVSLSFTALEISFLLHTFSNLILMCIGVVFFVFILLEECKTLGFVKF